MLAVIAIFDPFRIGFKALDKLYPIIGLMGLAWVFVNNIRETT